MANRTKSPERTAIMRERAKKGGLNKKGKKHHTTIDREEILKQVKDIGASRAKTLINVQTLLAVGTISVYVIRTRFEGKKKIKEKPELITNDKKIIDVLDYEYGDGDSPSSDDEYFFVQKNTPDNHAINSILDRTFGRATENKSIVIEKGIGALLDEIEEE